MTGKSKQPTLGRVQTDSEIIKAYGGLHHIKGNRKPYFSLTGATWEKDRNGNGWREACGGCIHETLLEHFPHLAPLAALHLSDIDGVPMHAAANGLYWLAGMFPDGLGETYHGGNGNRYGKPETQEETIARCRKVAESHFRCAIPQGLLDELATAGVFTGLREKRAAIVAAFCDAQKERWKQEADSCVAALGLVVYGDEWNGVA